MTAMPEHPDFQIREPTESDLEFAWTLYRDLMKPLTEEMLAWDERRQKDVVANAMSDAGTSIVTIDGTRIGWFQIQDRPDALQLAQLYIEPRNQNQGIGTEIIRVLRKRALHQGKPVKLEVMINNRARVLYERLGFRAIGRSKYKIEMQWSERD